MFAKDDNISRRRGRGHYKRRGGGIYNQDMNNVRDLEKMVILPIIVEILGIKLLTRKSKYKIKGMIKGTLLNLHIMLLHIVI